jgi:hypothetical protein
MATIAELMRARNHIAVWEQENGREATPDDIMVILYNQKVEEERAKREARKRRKQKQPKKKEYLTKRDREYIIVMAACTQGLQNIIDGWQEHDQHSFLLQRFCSFSPTPPEYGLWSPKDGNSTGVYSHTVQALAGP